MEIKEGERAIIKYVSTATVDRDGEILMPDGADLKDFRKNPVVLFGHNYLSLPVGKDQWIKVDGRGIKAKTLYASVEANPLAEQVYQLQKEKILNTSSVGFIPVKVSERGTDDYEKAIKKIETVYGISEKKSRNASRIYEKWILLEHSDVPVPSNPDALNIAIGKGVNISEDMKEKMSEYLEIEETPEPKDAGGFLMTPEELLEHLKGTPQVNYEYLVEEDRLQKQKDRNEELEAVIDDLLAEQGEQLADVKTSIFPIVKGKDDNDIAVKDLLRVLVKRDEKITKTVEQLIDLKMGKVV